MPLIDSGVVRRATNSPRGYLGVPPGAAGLLESDVPRPVVRHKWACALVTRGGACDCTPTPEPPTPPDLRTSSRGFTYDLTQMLGDSS